MRTKIEERRVITKEEKAELLKKTGGRCAHCGIPLTINTVTADHAIPLDKGGSNYEHNLVPLCDDCNQSKSNLVMIPSQYFKYLAEDIKRDLNIRYDLYCQNTSWIGPKELTREDMVIMRYATISRKMTSHASKKRSDERGTLYSMHPRKAILKKAEYSDLDAIIHYTAKYHSKFGLDKSHLKETITRHFEEGCIYVVYKGEEIIGVLPVTIEKVCFKDGEYYMPDYAGVPCLYQRPEYMQLIIDCINYINQGIALSNKKNMIIYSLHMPTKDPFIEEMVGQIALYGPTWVTPKPTLDESEEEWGHAIVLLKYNQDEPNYEDIEENEKQYFKFVSKHIKDLFDLRPIIDTNSKRNTAAGVKKKGISSKAEKELKRTKRAQIDEYESYYGLTS